MTHDTPKFPRRPRKVGPLAIAALLTSGLIQPVLPAFAQLTGAGQQISNTATATYSDSAGGDPISATSNTVTVTVAEVAGLTAVPAGFTDLDGGAVESGDTLQFNFDITNVGNAETDVFIPGINNLTAENFTPSTVEIVNSAGTVIATVPAAGANITSLVDATASPSANISALAPNGVLRVRVTGTPAAGTSAGSDVGVTLGNTGPNNNSASTQNQPDNADGAGATAQAQDIRTINVGADTPVNGEREASATNSIPFASSVQPLALAQVTKVASTLAPGATGNANDDLITYDLGLSVLNTSPNAAFTPEDLEGTTINLDGSNVERILVSDAIPANTDLSSVDFASLPANWAVVYTTSATTVPAVGARPAAGTTPAGAEWLTFDQANPPTLSSVRRIGFVYTGTTNNGNIAPGSSFSPFRFTVITSRVDSTGGQVANIAQVFGQTEGDPNNEIVYDESGDSNPNNFNDNGTPPDATGTNFEPAQDNGVANPVADGVDTGNNNTGTGPDGEANVVNLGSVAGSDDILNGPNGVPGANGPTDDNDDFTNQTTDVPAGVGPTDTFDPASETFNNTVQNPASAGFIADVTLQPISPTQAEGADESTLTGQYGANSDIPNGTLVTITATDENNVVQTATYSFNGSIFTLQSSTSQAPTDPNPVTDATPEHVNVGNLPAGQTLNYTVQVDLPAGTSPNDEIPIPVVAFPDDDPRPVASGGTPGLTGETTNNITINRVYTGFMQLTKEVQILDENGVIVQAFTSDQAVLNGLNSDANANNDLRPGYQLEYRITYENISTPSTGTGNTTLTAFGLQILEASDPSVTDPANGNTWAAFTTHEQNTSADQGTVEYFSDFGGNTALPSSDPVAGTQVQRYENEVGQVDPGQSGQFQFRRRVR